MSAASATPLALESAGHGKQELLGLGFPAPQQLLLLEVTAGDLPPMRGEGGGEGRALGGIPR